MNKEAYGIQVLLYCTYITIDITKITNKQTLGQANTVETN